MLIIGSTAMRYNGMTIDRRTYDIDYIATIDEFEREVAFYKSMGQLQSVMPLSKDHMVITLKGNSICEYEIAWPGNTNEEILNLTRLKGAAYADLNTMLMIKLSHRYKKNSPHFLKTMRDIQQLREEGAILDPELKGILKRREKETYSYNHPSLKQGKKKFFKEEDNIYIWEHDDIHKAVAVGDAPAYTKFSKDGEEVMVDKKKWEQLGRIDRLLAGLEESYVLAIERSLVPHPGVLSPKQAFDKALEKVCTSITSGWFREYCWENYDAIQVLYSENYYQKFLTALQLGKIRRYKE